MSVTASAIVIPNEVRDMYGRNNQDPSSRYALARDDSRDQTPAGVCPRGGGGDEIKKANIMVKTFKKIKKHAAVISCGIAIFLSIFLLVYANKPEFIPTAVISIMTLLFAFFAYRFSEEKFRLELLEKRWAIYEKTLEFCSVVIKHGGISKYNETTEDRNKDIVRGLQAASESFRGIGYHKMRALFGIEIHECFEELNKCYSWLITYQTDKPSETAEKYSKTMKFVWDTINTLPDLFKPYVYFGDYKRTL